MTFFFFINISHISFIIEMEKAIWKLKSSIHSGSGLSFIEVSPLSQAVALVYFISQQESHILKEQISS